MVNDTLVQGYIFALLVLANLPFINQRLFVLIPVVKSGQRKPFWFRLVEWFVLYAIGIGIGLYLEDQIEDPDDEFTMLLYTSRKFDPFEQLQHIVWTHEKFFHESGEHERYLTKLDMHVFFPRELQMLFLATGFSIDAIYGGYDWKPFGRGTRQIVVGRKGSI